MPHARLTSRSRHSKGTGHRPSPLCGLHTVHSSPTQASNSPSQEKSRGAHCRVSSWAPAPSSASPSPRATPEAGGGWASRELWGPALQLTTYYPPGLRAPSLVDGVWEKMPPPTRCHCIPVTSPGAHSHLTVLFPHSLTCASVAPQPGRPILGSGTPPSCPGTEPSRLCSGLSLHAMRDMHS